MAPDTDTPLPPDDDRAPGTAGDAAQDGAPDGAGAVPECREADDLYSPQARESIGRFCERLLNENALTPTEVLHAPRHQTTLSNQPLFVGILQQVDRTLQRKLGSIDHLVNDVARLTRERIKDWEVPELTPATYGATIGRMLAVAETFQAHFIADAALAQHLQTSRTFAEKAALLVELAGATDDADALAPIDRLLGEIVRCESGMASVAGDLPFDILVDAITTLIAGDRALEEDAPALLRDLERLMRRTATPALTDGLLVALRRTLARPDRLTTTSRGDLLVVETVQREALALGALADRLRDPNGAPGDFLGGPRTAAAIERRMSLLINEDTLPELVKGRSYVERLEILFMVKAMPLAATSARAVDAYLRQYFDSRDFAGRLLDCWKDRVGKLKGVAGVQRLVLASPFPEEERTALADQLDEIQSAFIRTQRLLAPFAPKADPPPDRVLDMVKLAADNAFCQGKSRIAVARVLYRQVHRPRFLRPFLLSASGSKDRAARAAWLRGALAGVGLPFLDLSAVTVLVIDDEEGLRSYGESVLRELGIGTVETAVDGKDALDRFAADPDRYDLIVCDWMMPQVSGLEVLERVRAARPDLPFLMVTALATRKAVERALASNVSAYIAKPFTPEQLEEKALLVLTQRGEAQG